MNQRRVGGALRAGHRAASRRQCSGEAPPHRPGAGVLGQPRARATTCWPRRCRPRPGAGGRGDRRVLVSRATCRAYRSTAPTCACGRSSALHPADGVALRDPLADPACGRARVERRGDRGGAVRRRPHVRAGRAAVRAGARARGAPGQRGRGAATAGSSICAGDEPVRFDPPAGLEGVLAIPTGEVPTAAAREAMPDEVPLADAVHNVAHASLLVLGLARDDFSLIGRGLARPPPPAAPALALPALDGAAGAAPTSWAPWARRSPARARPCCSGATGSRPGTLVERLRAEAPDCEVRRVQFAPGGRGRARAVSGEVRRPAACSMRDGRVRAGPPAPLRRLVAAQGQARSRRDASRRPRCARWRRRRGCAAGWAGAAEHRVPRREGPAKARALLARWSRRRASSRRTTRWTSCAGSIRSEAARAPELRPRPRAAGGR